VYKPIVDIETEETKNHLTMKKYFPNNYLNSLLEADSIFNLSEDPREAFKLNYISE
jgi:hypothetical protein